MYVYSRIAKVGVTIDFIRARPNKMYGVTVMCFLPRDTRRTCFVATSESQRHYLNVVMFLKVDITSIPVLNGDIHIGF